MTATEVVEFPAIDTTTDPFKGDFGDPNDPTRVYPRQFASGNQQGVQTLSDSRVFIDSGNGRIVFSDDDGSTITVGITTDENGDPSGFGFSFVDANGKNNLVLGRLPDGSVNLAIAKDGNNVSDAFS